MEQKPSPATLGEVLNGTQSFTWAEIKEAREKAALLIALDAEQADRFNRFYSAAARQFVTALLLHVRKEQQGPNHAPTAEAAH